MSSTPQTRRTRIVCVSDTHNQTPSLPKGDVLIHAGDLTNQGTHSELSKTISWLEKSDFESKIIVAGNHDLTLDSDFYSNEWAQFHNQRKQSSEECIALLRDSPSITYLDHEAEHVKLKDPSGPRTHLTVFGSPYSPAHGAWAFRYTPEEAEALWSQIPLSTDIVVTHTPPKGHCDRVAQGNKRAGCEALLQRLTQVRPRLHVCGHLHEGRGAESILWKDDGSAEWYEESFKYWNDPGAGEGNRKQSLLSLMPEKGEGGEWFSTRVARSKARAKDRRSPRTSEDGSKGRQRASGEGEEGVGADAADGEQSPPLASRVDRSMTCVVNAAIMQNSWGGPKRLNKPIVVDIDLPVWNG